MRKIQRPCTTKMIPEIWTWAVVAALGVCGSGAARAVSVTTISGALSNSTDTDYHNLVANAVVNPAVPLNQESKATATAYGDYASSTYNFSNSVFLVTMNDVGTFDIGESSGSVIFTVQPSVAGGGLSYNLSGNYNISGLGSSGSVYFSAALYDQTKDPNQQQPLFENIQQGTAIPNGSFVLGGQAGTSPTLSGNLTGSLIAGDIYLWTYDALVDDSQTPPEQGLGQVQLAFSEKDPVAVPLPSAAGIGFSLLAGLGAMFAARKRLGRGARIA